MGRIKNRGQQALSTPCTVRRWRLGEYIRLSKEDLKKGRDDSNSVKNQRDLLNEFYQKHIDEFESMSEYSEIVARINSAPVKKSQSFRLEDLIAAKEKELSKITRYKQALYQDWKDGEITQQDYREMKADYERQTITMTAVLENLTKERAELANGVNTEHPALAAFIKHQNIDGLSRDILIDLIDHIKVYDNGNISVRFKFSDELRRIAEYIDLNTENPAKVG